MVLDVARMREQIEECKGNLRELLTHLSSVGLDRQQVPPRQRFFTLSKLREKTLATSSAYSSQKRSIEDWCVLRLYCVFSPSE